MDVDDGGSESVLLSHIFVVVVVVDGLQGSGSTGSAADSPFEPYDANVLLAADVVYNVSDIPNLIRPTRKFILLLDRLPPLPPCIRSSAQTVAVIVAVGDSHQQRR